MKRVYECDTCRKQIELSNNGKDITLLNRCIITQGCTGGLHSTLSSRNPQSDVDYQSRNVLYEHQQVLASDTWTVSHHLNSDPITHVYRDQLNDVGKRVPVLVDPDEYELYYIDPNTTTIVFESGCSGVVHSVARSSSVAPIEIVDDSIEYIQSTANSILTIAVKNRDGLGPTTEHHINFVSPSTGESTRIPLTFSSHRHNDNIALFDTPWKGFDEIYLGGYGYKVQSVRVDNVIAGNNIEHGSPFFFDDSDFVILLSRSPYAESVDIDNVNYIRPTGLTSQTIDIAAKVTGANLSIDSAHILSYHPTIKVVKNTF